MAEYGFFSKPAKANRKILSVSFKIINFIKRFKLASDWKGNKIALSAHFFNSRHIFLFKKQFQRQNPKKISTFFFTKCLFKVIKFDNNYKFQC